MEGYQKLTPYEPDPALFQNGMRNIDLIRNVIGQLARERRWIETEETLKYMNQVDWASKFISLEEKGFAFVGFFRKEENRFKKEGLLIHLDNTVNEKRSYVFVYIFPELVIHHDGYYERGGTSVFLRDGEYVVYRESNTYADCADIHDHDHYSIEVEALYSLREHAFYYPE